MEYVPNGSPAIANRPWLSVFVVQLAPVDLSVTVTVALGIKAPAWSETVPEIRPVAVASCTLTAASIKLGTTAAADATWGFAHGQQTAIRQKRIWAALCRFPPRRLGRWQICTLNLPAWPNFPVSRFQEQSLTPISATQNFSHIPRNLPPATRVEHPNKECGTPPRRPRTIWPGRNPPHQ
jgi:hypothetical protein